MRGLKMLGRFAGLLGFVVTVFWLLQGLAARAVQSTPVALGAIAVVPLLIAVGYLWTTWSLGNGNRWGAAHGLALVVVTLTGVSLGCTQNITSIGQGGGGGNVSGGGVDGGTPTPGSGGNLPEGSFVRVGLFGQSCPQGVTPPNNGAREIKQGCTGFATATPKRADGSDLTLAEHGPNCSWSITSGSAILSMSDAGNPFNRDLRCPGLGEANVSAVVKNVTGSLGLTCTQGVAARASAEANLVFVWDEPLLAVAAAREGLSADALRARTIERTLRAHRLPREEGGTN